MFRRLMHIMASKKRPLTGRRHTASCCDVEQRPSALHITELPTEVLVLIFECCPYEVVSKDLRQVCKRFREVATSVLNHSFSTLGSKIDRTMKTVDCRINQARTETDSAKMKRALDGLQILKSEVRNSDLSVLQPAT
jgi:hypothetical protein